MFTVVKVRPGLERYISDDLPVPLAPRTKSV
jgi:hypothetical protein